MTPTQKPIDIKLIAGELVVKFKLTRFTVPDEPKLKSNHNHIKYAL